MKEFKEALDELRAEAESVYTLMSDAADEQWRPSRYATRTDTAKADPTGDTAVDPRRLALRAAVVSAEYAVLESQQALQEAASALRRAREAWAGDLTQG